MYVTIVLQICFQEFRGGSLRYKVFLVSKIIVLRYQILAKLARPKTSTPPLTVNTQIHTHTHTHIYIYIYIHIYTLYYI